MTSSAELSLSRTPALSRFAIHSLTTVKSHTQIYYTIPEPHVFAARPTSRVRSNTSNTWPLSQPSNTQGFEVVLQDQGVWV